MQKTVCRIPRATVGILILAAAALVGTPAFAQDRTGTVEITPFAGGYFGGTLYGGSTAVYGHDVDVASSGLYGVRVGGNVNRWFGLEASFAMAKPNVDSQGGDQLFGPNRKLGELDVKQYDLNAMFNFGSRKVIGFFTIGGGATTFQLTVPGYETSTDTRFSTNIGGGVKFFLNPHVGLRFEGRARTTYLSGGSCDRYYHDTCNGYYYSDSNWYWSGEATGGLTIAF